MLKATTGGGGDRQIPEPGMHPARCVAVIDLGTHVDERYKNERTGKPTRAHKVQIQWELPGQTFEFEGVVRPMMATKRYTLSVHEKANLRKDLESWYGKQFNSAELEAKGFDLEKLLGRPALLNLTHSEDGKYANIKSINPPMKGLEMSEQVNPSRAFDLDAPSLSVWATLSKKTRDFIRQSEEVVSGRSVVPDDPAEVKSEEQTVADIMAPVTASDDEVPF